MNSKIDKSFFTQDVLVIAPKLPGHFLCRKFENGKFSNYLITEVEAYKGENDKACHARFGRTKRTEIMYHDGGKIYMYLIYGMYWMLNIVTGKKDHPQAILIRGIYGYDGPGKLTRHLKLDKSFNAEDLTKSERIWLKKPEKKYKVLTSPRIGIDYAEEPWKSKNWRFFIKPK